MALVLRIKWQWTLSGTSAQVSRALPLACDGLTVYSAKRIENAVEEAISGFFSQIQSEIHAVWTSKDHKQIRTFSEGKLDIAEKNLSRLESQRKALEHETVESIMGNSRYDFEVLTKLINDNKVALGEAFTLLQFSCVFSHTS